MADEAEAGTRSEGSPDPVIVIGSSAGGGDALSVLVGTLPDRFPAPIILAQHLDPRRPSHLSEILQRHTKLPVRAVEDHAVLEPGVILVVPPNRNATFEGSELRLVEAVSGPRPSIDGLMSAAARTFGDAVVAVILTGTGLDGALGAADVKAAGGTVVIQNPETASYPSMPAAIPPTIVDVVADIEAIGPLLEGLVGSKPVAATSAEERLLRALLDELRSRSGIDFSAYKSATIQRRLQRRIAATRNSGLRDYVRYTRTHPEELQRLANSFLIKVTDFFRDADLFSHLQEDVLPRLIAYAKEHDQELRIWSAGCATGEEAYSLAILVMDLLGNERDRISVRIFATDVDPDAIAFARRGVYPITSVRGVSPEILARHFTRYDENHYEVGRQIRSVTVFGQHDLAQRAPFPRIDLALCRNVLIYFTPELQKHALELFAFSLREGGIMVLGKAESITPAAQLFVLEEARLKVHRRRGERVNIAPTRAREPMPAGSTSRRTRPIPSQVTAPPSDAEMRVAATVERADAVLLRLPVGVVVVDGNYDIQSINSAARSMLAIHGLAVGEDLVHLVPESLAGPIKAAIDAAFRRDEASASQELVAPTMDGTETRTVRLTCELLFTGDERHSQQQVVVLVADVTPDATRRTELQERFRASDEGAERLRNQARVLMSTNAELIRAKQDLANANLDLKSANQEMVVASEEVQAATEEVETLNEELQATNEELETLNEELQSTVEELITTNDDLQARSAEFEDVAATLADARAQANAERDRLNAVLNALPDGVALVDRAGSVIWMNESFARTIGGQARSIPDGDGKALDLTELAGRAAREAFSEEADGGDGRLRLEGLPLDLHGDRSAVLIVRPHRE